MLPDEAVKEFQELYLRLYGELLSDEEAKRKAEKLVSLYEAVYEQDSNGDD